MTPALRRTLEVLELPRMTAVRLAAALWPKQWRKLRRNLGQRSTLVANARGLLRRAAKAGYAFTAFEPMTASEPVFEISSAGRAALGPCDGQRTLRDAYRFLRGRRFRGEPVQAASALLALLLLVPGAVHAEEPGVRFDVITWGQAAYSGVANRLTVGGRISIDGPLALGEDAPARIYVDLDITAMPGQSLDFTSVEAFGRSAEVNLGLYRRIGGVEVGGQTITTSVFAEGGFATALEQDPVERYIRHGSIGFRLAEEKSGTELFLAACRHEAAGEFGWGQLCLAGQVPLAFTRGVLVLGGDAIIAVGPRDRYRQRDVLRLFVGVGLPDLIGAFRR